MVFKRRDRRPRSLLRSLVRAWLALAVVVAVLSVGIGYAKHRWFVWHVMNERCPGGSIGPGGEPLIVTNEDMEELAIERFLEAVAEDPQLGVVAARSDVRYADGSVRHRVSVPTTYRRFDSVEAYKEGTPAKCCTVHRVSSTESWRHKTDYRYAYYPRSLFPVRRRLTFTVIVSAVTEGPSGKRSTATVWGVAPCRVRDDQPTSVEGTKSFTYDDEQGNAR